MVVPFTVVLMRVAVVFGMAQAMLTALLPLQPTPHLYSHKLRQFVREALFLLCPQPLIMVLQELGAQHSIIRKQPLTLLPLRLVFVQPLLP